MVTQMSLQAFLSNRRHAGELARNIRNRRWSREASGIRIPSMGLFVGGHAEHFLNDGPRSVDHNLVTDQGINHILSVAIADGTKTSTWYMAPFAGAVDPVTSLTAATFTATQTEFLNYTSATRPAYVEAAGTKSMTNTASPALLTINADTQTVWGAGILSTAAKSSTSGVLLAAVRFSAVRDGLMTNDVLGLIYTLTAADS